MIAVEFGCTQDVLDFVMMKISLSTSTAQAVLQICAMVICAMELRIARQETFPSASDCCIMQKGLWSTRLDTGSLIFCANCYVQCMQLREALFCR